MSYLPCDSAFNTQDMNSSICTYMINDRVIDCLEHVEKDLQQNEKVSMLVFNEKNEKLFLALFGPNNTTVDEHHFLPIFSLSFLNALLNFANLYTVQF